MMADSHTLLGRRSACAFQTALAPRTHVPCAISNSFITPLQPPRHLGNRIHRHPSSTTRRPCTIVTPTASQATTSSATKTQQPRVPVTTTRTFTDRRGKTWTYGQDILNAHSSRTPIVLLHNVVAVGLTRWYWDPLFRLASTVDENHFLHRPLVRFDFVYTGDSHPKPDRAPQPQPSLDEFADQVADVCAGLSTRPFVLSIGGVELVALRFAGRYPDSLSALLLHNGVSTRYVTQDVYLSTRTKLLYGALSGVVGKWFYQYYSTRDFIRSFLLKNIWVDADDEIFEEKVSKSVTAAQADVRVRYPFLAFLAGCFFMDLTDDLANIAVPTLFIGAGKIAPGKLKNQTAATRFRIPFSVAAKESSMVEAREQRILDHRRNIKGCEAILAENVGPDEYFVDPMAVLPIVERFLKKEGL